MASRCATELTARSTRSSHTIAYSAWTPTGEIITCAKDRFPRKDLEGHYSYWHAACSGKPGFCPMKDLIEQAADCPDFTPGEWQWIGIDD